MILKCSSRRRGKTAFSLAKTQGLATTYRKYTEFLQDNFLDPDDYLKLAVESIPDQSHATPWCGLTVFRLYSREYQVIGAMLKTTQVTSLCAWTGRKSAPARNKAVPSRQGSVRNSLSPLPGKRGSVGKCGHPGQDGAFTQVQAQRTALKLRSEAKTAGRGSGLTAR